MKLEGRRKLIIGAAFKSGYGKTGDAYINAANRLDEENKIKLLKLLGYEDNELEIFYNDVRNDYKYIEHFGIERFMDKMYAHLIFENHIVTGFSFADILNKIKPM